MLHHRPTVKQARAACHRWNQRHPIGTPVTVQQPGAEPRRTATRSEAFVVSGRAAVQVEGDAAAYLLAQVRVVQDTHHSPPAKAAAGFALARQLRVDRMWSRFVRLMQAEGLEVNPDVEGVAARVLLMMHRVRCGIPKGWYFESALETGDLGLQPTEFAPGEPTTALPGTPAKVQALAARACGGQRLWHPGDAKAAE